MSLFFNKKRKINIVSEGRREELVSCPKFFVWDCSSVSRRLKLKCNCNYFFLSSEQSADEWRTVFYIMGAVFLLGGIFYVLFASGEKQPWANGNEYDKLMANESSTNE